MRARAGAGGGAGGGGRGTRGALRALFAVQLLLGAGLVWHDLGPQLQGGLGPLLAPKAPRLDAPVAPGDQVRRFAPATRPAPGPGTPFPARGDIPDRLTLAEETVAGEPAIALVGAIAPGDADRLGTALAAADPAPRVAWLDSPGGSVGDALAIGRQLRAAGIETRVADGAICLSACPYMLAGGTEREVAESGVVGVHQHYFGESTVLPAFMAIEDVQRGQSEVMAYLDEMGVDPRLMGHAMATPPAEIYILVPEELERYGLISGE